MNFSEILYAIVALASAIAAILAWIDRIRWSDRYKEAKEAQIASIERELEAVKNSKDDHIKMLQGQIEYLKVINSRKSQRIFRC